MLKICIYSIILLLFVLFISNLSISFNPFKISLPDWHKGLGVVLLILGFIIYGSGEYYKGYIEGAKKGIEKVIYKFKSNCENKRY